MIKRFYVPTSKLEEGMQIDQVIKDRLDRTLIARGSALDAYLIEGLKKRGIHGVYIKTGEEDPEKKPEEETLTDRKSTRLNSSHKTESRMPSSA